jgi:hypothetical protein
VVTCAKGGAGGGVLVEVIVYQAVFDVTREKGREGQEKFAG